MTLPPAVTIHGLDHARAALRPGRPVLLLSAPGAALYAGVAWWRALIQAIHDEFPAQPAPDALDCADAPGRALEALAAGCRLIILESCPAAGSVLARAGSARILDHRPPALDLNDLGAARGLVAWLGQACPPSGSP